MFIFGFYCTREYLSFYIDSYIVWEILHEWAGGFPVLLNEDISHVIGSKASNTSQEYLTFSAVTTHKENHLALLEFVLDANEKRTKKKEKRSRDWASLLRCNQN